MTLENLPSVLRPLLRNLSHFRATLLGSLVWLLGFGLLTGLLAVVGHHSWFAALSREAVCLGSFECLCIAGTCMLTFGAARGARPWPETVLAVLVGALALGLGSTALLGVITLAYTGLLVLHLRQHLLAEPWTREHTGLHPLALGFGVTSSLAAALFALLGVGSSLLDAVLLWSLAATGAVLVWYWARLPVVLVEPQPRRLVPLF